MTTEQCEGRIAQSDMLEIVNSSKYWVWLRRNNIQKSEVSNTLNWFWQPHPDLRMRLNLPTEQDDPVSATVRLWKDSIDDLLPK